MDRGDLTISARFPDYVQIIAFQSGTILLGEAVLYSLGP